jgi:hypothetical protein
MAGAVVVYLCLAWLLAKRYLLHAGWRVLPVLVAVPALAFTLNELRWQHFESELADAAQPVLGGRDAGFSCERLMHDFWSSQGHVGHVWFDADGGPANDAFLSSGTCAAVKRWQHRPAAAGIDEIVAVHTVTHEAFHLAGERSEAAAECGAIAADQAVMERLGATPDVARSQVARYVTEVYPRLPDDYRGDCAAAATVTAPARTTP